MRSIGLLADPDFVYLAPSLVERLGPALPKSPSVGRTDGEDLHLEAATGRLVGARCPAGAWPSSALPSGEPGEMTS